MSDSGKPDLENKPDLEKQSQQNEPDSSGPSLVLLYSLVALALVGAIFLAVLIVLPFYRRAH